MAAHALAACMLNSGTARIGRLPTAPQPAAAPMAGQTFVQRCMSAVIAGGPSGGCAAARASAGRCFTAACGRCPRRFDRSGRPAGTGLAGAENGDRLIPAMPPCRRYRTRSAAKQPGGRPIALRAAWGCRRSIGRTWRCRRPSGHPRLPPPPSGPVAGQDGGGIPRSCMSPRACAVALQVRGSRVRGCRQANPRLWARCPSRRPTVRPGAERRAGRAWTTRAAGAAGRRNAGQERHERRGPGQHGSMRGLPPAAARRPGTGEDRRSVMPAALLRAWTAGRDGWR